MSSKIVIFIFSLISINCTKLEDHLPNVTTLKIKQEEQSKNLSALELEAKDVSIQIHELEDRLIELNRKIEQQKDILKLTQISNLNTTKNTPEKKTTTSPITQTRFVGNAVNKNNKNNKDIFVIMCGQVARDVKKSLCTIDGKNKQLSATKTQTSLFSKLQNEFGYDVKLLLSMNSCDDNNAKNYESTINFNKLLIDSYGDWLIDYKIDNCNGYPASKCRIQNGINLYRQLPKTAKTENSLVMLTRPDLYWHENTASTLVADMAKLAWSNYMAWPFKCQSNSWKSWKCVADTVVMVKASHWEFFNTQCVRKVSCYPEDLKQNGKFIPSIGFDRTSGLNVVHPTRIAFGSGHGCYRCAKQKMKEKDEHGNVIMPGIARDENYDINTRAMNGQNPYYYFGGG